MVFVLVRGPAVSACQGLSVSAGEAPLLQLGAFLQGGAALLP